MFVSTGMKGGTQVLRALSWLKTVLRRRRPDQAPVDPAVDVEQSLERTAAEIGRFRQELARSLFDERKLEAAVREGRVRAEDAERHARLAMDSGDEGKAREALTTQLEAERRVQDAETRLNDQRKVVGSLRESLRVLAQRLDDVTRRRNALLARQGGARAKQVLAEELGGANGTRSLDVWEEQVRKSEREARFSLDVLSNLGTGESEMDRQYREAAESARVDGALTELRNRRGREPQR
jgi:phage shock protein A